MKKQPIQDQILKALGAKKMVKMPDLYQGVEKGEKDPTKAKYALNRSIKTLRDNNLVEQFDTPQNSFLRLTKEGRQKLQSLNLSSDTSLVNTVWDGMWRIIILDLPEDRKSERESLRYLLKKAGFVCVKNSVYASPYPFEHLFINIKNDLGFTTEMMIVVTDKIDPATEAELTKNFWS